MLEYIYNNHEWIFSGIGLLLITLLISIMSVFFMLRHVKFRIKINADISSKNDKVDKP